MAQYNAMLAQAEALRQAGRAGEAVAGLTPLLAVCPERPSLHAALFQAHAARGRLAAARVHARIHDALDAIVEPLLDAAVSDTLFLDPGQALEAARRGETLPRTNAVSARRLCYHLGPAISGAPETMINLPLAGLGAFIQQTRLRLPTDIQFDPLNPDQRRMALGLVTLLDSATDWRLRESNRLLQIGRMLAPEFQPGAPLRVLICASRLTTVMQHASRHIAAALERQGCAVRFEIEASDLEELDLSHWVRLHAEINPHLTVNINFPNHLWLHQDVFNVVWYQDPVAGLTRGEKIPWRKRDRILSAYPEFDALIERTGGVVADRQDFCVDRRMFRNETPLEERRKIVFVGTSHRNLVAKYPNREPVLAALQAHFDAGELVDEARAQALAEQNGLSFIDVFDYIYPHVVRDLSLERLCRMAPRLKRELGLDVEIYGRFWDENPLIAPYYKGPVTYGAPLAELYNQTRYAIAPYTVIKSQRLAESAACGCIPLLYDMRPLAEGPYWEDRILYFRTEAELARRLTEKPPAGPDAIAEAFSYDRLAERILAWVRAEAGLDG